MQTLPAAPRCANCDAATTGDFCAACGQRAEALRQPVHHFLRDAFTEFFGLDGRVWRTLGALVFTPGTLSRAYFAGRRQLYLRPLRVYLTSTLLFFFLLSLIDPIGRTRDNLLDGPGRANSLTVAALIAQTDSSLAVDPDSVAAARVARKRAEVDSTIRAAMAPSGIVGADAAQVRQERLAEARADGRETLAEVQDDARNDAAEARANARRYRLERAILLTLPPDSVVSEDDIRGAVNMIHPDSVGSLSIGGTMIRNGAAGDIIGARTDKERADATVAFVRATVGYVPTVLFLILPVFALLLKLLYVRRDWFYSEHVVFALHTHAYAFVAFTAIIAATWSLSESGALVQWIVGLLALSVPVYFLVAQKRVYGQGWRKTVAKALILGTVYNAVLILGIVGALALAATLG